MLEQRPPPRHFCSAGADSGVEGGAQVRIRQLPLVLERVDNIGARPRSCPVQPFELLVRYSHDWKPSGSALLAVLFLVFALGTWWVIPSDIQGLIDVKSLQDAAPDEASPQTATGKAASSGTCVNKHLWVAGAVLGQVRAGVVALLEVASATLMEGDWSHPWCHFCGWVDVDGAPSGISKVRNFDGLSSGLCSRSDLPAVHVPLLRLACGLAAKPVGIVAHRDRRRVDLLDRLRGKQHRGRLVFGVRGSWHLVLSGERAGLHWAAEHCRPLRWPAGFSVLDRRGWAECVCLGADIRLHHPARRRPGYVAGDPHRVS